ncbi:MAG TPA: hypothetical protein VFW98_14640 [Gemmatimonadaceae bacterium]|nr:hypothetical protein [Gemmatimonadaceae bacterium]
MTTVATVPVFPRARAHDRVFYGAMAVIVAAIVFVGFAPTFYLAPQFHRATPSSLRVVHGVMFTAWIILFMVQTALIATGRVGIHRRLGVAGAVLAAGMVVMGTTMAIVAAREGHAPPGFTPLVFLVVPIFDMLLFAPLVALAVFLRRRPQAHKRLMLLATISLLGAPAARLPAGFHLPGMPFVYVFCVTTALLLAGVLYDAVSRRRVHPAYVWGGLIILASTPLRLTIGGTHAWLVIASLLTGQPVVPPTATRQAAFVARAGPNVVNVITREFAFSMPDTIPAGLTTFHLRNEGRQPHHLMLYRLDPGRTVADADAALRAGGAHPAWMHAAGGPNAVPHGGESTATLVLQPGSYIAFCHVKSPDNLVHFMKGMFKGITVVPSSTTSAPLPAADLTVTLRDYTFTFSRPPTRGHHRIAVTNAGTQRHELILSRLHARKSSRDFVRWMDTQQGPPPVDAYGGVTDIAPGTTVVIDMDLVPGRYSMVCRVRDAGDNQPHDRHGMLAEFEVS